MHSQTSVVASASPGTTRSRASTDWAAREGQRCRDHPSEPGPRANRRSGIASRVGPTLDILDNSKLASLDGLEGLQTVAHLAVTNNPRLSQVDGLRSLATAETLALQGSSPLSSLKGLANLNEVGTLTLSGFPALTELAGLEHLSQVSVLTLSNLQGLTSVAALRQLRQLWTLTLSDLPLLGSLTGLEQLGEVQYDLTIGAFQSSICRGFPACLSSATTSASERSAGFPRRTSAPDERDRRGGD